jgi:hypothetical protein
MVNCCIHRKIQNAPQNGNTEDSDIKPSRNVGNLFDNVSTQINQQQKKSRASKFQSLIEKFVDGSESAMKVFYLHN